MGPSAVPTSRRYGIPVQMRWCRLAGLVPWPGRVRWTIWSRRCCGGASRRCHRLRSSETRRYWLQRAMWPSGCWGLRASRPTPQRTTSRTSSIEQAQRSSSRSYREAIPRPCSRLRSPWSGAAWQATSPSVIWPDGCTPSSGTTVPRSSNCSSSSMTCTTRLTTAATPLSPSMLGSEPKRSVWFTFIHTSERPVTSEPAIGGTATNGVGSPTSHGTLLRMARQRDPEREKRRSMDERVDAWGESQKAARKNLPKRRARTHRAYRRAVNVELQLGEDADATAIRRKSFDKWAGPARANHLERQAARREALEADPRRSDAARERRSARRTLSRDIETD